LIEVDQNARLLNRASLSVATALSLLGVIALLALSASPAMGGDSVGSTNDGQGETVTGSIVLDVYLDAGGRALLVGYLEIERLDDLAFLESSEYVHDEVTGELYALSGGLTSVREMKRGSCLRPREGGTSAIWRSICQKMQRC